MRGIGETTLGFAAIPAFLGSTAQYEMNAELRQISP
jgi:hypothetical protein